MPTYEYRCSDCGYQFETHGRIDDAAPTVCERCGGRLRKVFHPAGIVFKGSGFYATDSRSKKAVSKEGVDKNDSTSEAKPENTSGGTSGDKGDRKESKKESKKESTASGTGDSRKTPGSS